VAPEIGPDGLREALSYWASGVTIVAVRDGARVIGTTVSSFASVSLDPPLVTVVLGPNASVLPYLGVGATFGISILAEQQRRLATVYADSYPVGPDPFPPEGEPLLPGALAGLACTVQESLRRGSHTLIVARVREIRGGAGGQPLVRFRRSYGAVRD
jgi:3-hydroxy-9,10-secoandrosta-1,3,5(10)-triene-9,17-dione monooxygenase reductase component